MIKKIAFQTALGTDFDGFGAPFGSQDGAQNHHLGAKIGPRPPNLEPRWAKDLQLAAKMPPNRPQDGFMGRFLNFGPRLGRFLIDFE